MISKQQVWRSMILSFILSIVLVILSAYIPLPDHSNQNNGTYQNPGSSIFGDNTPDRMSSRQYGFPLVAFFRSYGGFAGYNGVISGINQGNIILNFAIYFIIFFGISLGFYLVRERKNRNILQKTISH